MDFSQDRTISKNTMIGIGVVILLHILLVYALVSGLATSAINVIKKPLEIKIIQEAPPPQAPPPPMQPPPPAMTTPPPPFIPPPLIQLQTPPPPQQVFAVTTTVKPPAPQAKATPPQPISNNVGVICSNFAGVASKLADQFQDIADQDEIDSANVVVKITIGPTGTVSAAQIVSSDSPDLNPLALQGVRGLHCQGQGQTVEATQPFVFKTQ